MTFFYPVEIVAAIEAEANETGDSKTAVVVRALRAVLRNGGPEMTVPTPQQITE